MYNGKHSTRPQPRRRRGSRKTAVLLLSLLLLTAMAVGGTVAYLFTDTAPKVNVFTPSTVDGKVEEEFDGLTKKNVTARNTGNIDAYIRLKLVSYRVNADGEQIGGEARIPAFTPGENWVKNGEYYYYTLPVAPNKTPAVPLISEISLVGEYTDSDGGRQTIEVMAEAIQSVPASAVGEAWGVKIAPNSVTPYTVQ